MKQVVIIGAGIIGLAVAHHLLRAGVAVTIVDRDPEGDKASFGNAGGIAVAEVVPASVPGTLWRVPGWWLDPLGPLALRPQHSLRLLPWLWRFSRVGSPAEVARISAALSALNKRTYDDLVPMLSEHGLSGELHRTGALTVYESENAFLRDSGEWELKARHGIQIVALTGDEARALEPALGPVVSRGVFTPQWSQVKDPKYLTDELRKSLLNRGLTITTGQVSTIQPSGSSISLALSDGRSLSAENLVIAAGAWSGILAKQLGDRALVESERGYTTTIPNPGVQLSREIIFAERKFVATPLSCGLRIGGAAEFGGLDAEANYKRSVALVKLASLYLPDLTPEGGTTWAGHRPTTPDSLPVISRSPRNGNVFYAFGHGHLGLTQAATTGKLTSDLILGIEPEIDLSPYAIDRFE
ncbi:FAD-binding oxidoreductase [Pseudomonas sp. MOB-449]|nr:FAD-binding oxidoreductase [Pseudomonas sp. MOB-449]